MADNTIDVAIVGGGLAGLVLAYRLHTRGLRCHIFEKQERIGGWIHSASQDGFLLESGPHSTVLRQSLSQLVKELHLQPALLEVESAQSRKWILLREPHGKNRLVPVPRSIREALFTPLLSTGGKLRALSEPFRSRLHIDDTSVETFIRHRFGSEVSERILGPALSGIWAAPLSELSARAALPTIYERCQEHGSMIKGALFGERKKPGEKRGPSVSFRGGLQTLVESLAAQLPPETVSVRHRVEGIRYKAEGIRLSVSDEAGQISIVHAKHLAMSGGTHASADLLQDIAPSLASRIAAIPLASLGQIHFSFETSAQHAGLPSGFGFLATHHDAHPLLGALFMSNVFPDRAPAGQQLLTAFVGGRQHADIDVFDDKTIEQVSAELQHVLKLQSAPKVIHQVQFRDAIPVYQPGHYELQEKVQRFEEEHPSLWILANWYRGLGLADRVTEAEQLAERILQTPSPTTVKT